MSFEGFPFILGWELTLICNLQCKHCGSTAGTSRAKELTTAEALDLCDQFPDLLVQEVDFTGGEPLLRPDWDILSRHLIKKEIQVNILSNGICLTKEMVAKLKDTGISCMGLSLDGLEKSHDFIRGRSGSYTSVMKAIDELQRAELPFNLITTVNALNIAELSAMLSLVQSIGVGFWRLQTLIPFGRVTDYPEMHVGPSEIRSLGTFIRNNKKTASEKGLTIICSDGLMYIDNSGMVEKPWRGCPAGIITCGITSDGKIKGCLSMSDILVEGDIRKNSLWDIWFHPDSFSYNRCFSQEELGPNCRSCDKSEECKGGCSANSHAATSIFHNDPYCHYKITNESGVALDQVTCP